MLRGLCRIDFRVTQMALVRDRHQCSVSFDSAQFLHVAMKHWGSNTQIFGLNGWMRDGSLAKLR
jgi:hypothetical protein